MPKRFPKEFRDDVVRVAHSGKFTHEEMVHDFNISLSSLKRWLHQADCVFRSFRTPIPEFSYTLR